MNKLEDYFWNQPKKCMVHKWHHYFDVYDRHFKRFVGKNPTILEIGVYEGGSLEMWNHYFDGNCTIYAVDINEKCKDLEKHFDNVKIYIGDQADREFWQHFVSEVPQLDIVIDDGGHTMQQQIVTYECIYPHIKEDGVFLCEDLHTSYWPSYGGGLKSPNTFIEYSKNFIDLINAYHTKPRLDLSFRQSTHSVHFYDSIVVLEKKKDTAEPVASRQH